MPALTCTRSKPKSVLSATPPSPAPGGVTKPSTTCTGAVERFSRSTFNCPDYLRKRSLILVFFQTFNEHFLVILKGRGRVIPCNIKRRGRVGKGAVTSSESTLPVLVTSTRYFAAGPVRIIAEDGRISAICPPSLPSNITRDCPPSLLVSQGIVLLSLLISQEICLPPF